MRSNLVDARVELGAAVALASRIYKSIIVYKYILI